MKKKHILRSSIPLHNSNLRFICTESPYHGKWETFLVIYLLLLLFKNQKLKHPLILGTVAFVIDMCLNIVYRHIPGIYPNMVFVSSPIIDAIFSLMTFVAIFYILKTDKYGSFILTAIITVGNLTTFNIQISFLSVTLFTVYTLAIFAMFHLIHRNIAKQRCTNTFFLRKQVIFLHGLFDSLPMALFVFCLTNYLFFLHTFPLKHSVTSHSVLNLILVQ